MKRILSYKPECKGHFLKKELSQKVSSFLKITLDVLAIVFEIFTFAKVMPYLGVHIV